MRTRLRIRAHATHPLSTHAIVWLVLAAAMFAQPVGLIAADTKHDLTADPAGFLAAATHAWTDVFPLGQLQNQAYGYLFPQGLFFLLADAIPDWLLPTWVAQRLWWTIVAGVGFSGFYRLCQCVVPGSGRATTASASIRAFHIIAALLFALSPRTLTTLTAISSETWPVMLAPWVLVPLLRGDKITGRDIAAATIPIALMGAVNATATLAACIPAGLVILWRRQGWLLLPAAVAVSAWWIGPLLVLGKYSPPFTDFIESSYVTTRWLNLLEILRGTTHWTPFADTEREAGYLLVSQPVFVLVTMAIAACGLAGLALRAQGAQGSHLRYHGLWLMMLLVGITILAAPYGQLLDDVLAPLRNLHKFDPLVRIPLLLGVAHLGTVLEMPRLKHPLTRRAAAGLGVAVIALLSVAPVWSGRLLPTGAYREVPEYWRQAADFLNDNVDTRTLLVPETSFARQEWGWTRDEPAQPLLDVPWAVRDAVPLLPPEAIRGLDGVLATLDRSVDPLLRLGIGAVLVRHDLDSSAQQERADELADALDRLADQATGGSPAVQRHDFGEVSIFVLDAQRDMHVAHDPVTVAGGGEALAVLDAIDGPAPRRLVDHAGAGAAEGSGAEDPSAEPGAEIVTDTPLLVDRNFGTLQGAVSGPLASPDEATTKHPSVDYPSVATPLPVRPRGDVQLQASSSAADATAFGGADPARSINAAVDGTDQAWWPAPGDPGTLQLRSTDDTVDAPELHLTTTEDARLRVLAFADEDAEDTDKGADADAAEAAVNASAGTSDEPIHTITVETAAGEDTRVAFPNDLRASRIEIQLNPETRTGVSDIRLAGHELSRLVHVPATANARQFVFQRLAVDTGVVQRSFEVPRTMQLEIRTDDEQPVTIDGTEYSAGETVELSGTHTISTAAAWVSLREPGFAPAARYEPVDGRTVPGAASTNAERLLVTGRAFNEGLRGELVDASGTVTELQPTSIDAATQAFVLPDGASGQFRMSFAGEAAYRMSLFVGAAVSLVTLAALVLFPLARPTASTQLAAARRRHARDLLATEPTLPAWAFPVAAIAVSGAVVGPAGAVSAAVAWAITRWTTIRPVVLAPALLGICGLWLARAPWPDAHYAGDSLLAACLAAGAVACLSQSRAGSSTKV